MVYHFKKQVTTPGTAVALSTVSIKAAWILFFPAKTDGSANSGQVRIGGAFQDPSTGALSYPTAIAAGYGAPLNAGGSNLVWNAQAANPFDLSQVRIDADNAADGVQGIYGTV